MVGLRQIDPTSYADLDRYLDLLNESRDVPDVADHLPEIFEEGSVWRVQQGVRALGVNRYFVLIDGQIVGRTELSRNLNDDPSIIPRIPEGISLGNNTCYFINPRLLGRAHDAAHRLVANASILQAFAVGDKRDGLSPWLPVSLDDNDTSRGWLTQTDQRFTVIGGEPEAGIFPQFGIGDNKYSIHYAVPTDSPE